jgi:hypothetical protein
VSDILNEARLRELRKRTNEAAAREAQAIRDELERRAKMRAEGITEEDVAESRDIGGER